MSNRFEVERAYVRVNECAFRELYADRVIAVYGEEIIAFSIDEESIRDEVERQGKCSCGVLTGTIDDILGPDEKRAISVQVPFAD